MIDRFTFLGSVQRNGKDIDIFRSTGSAPDLAAFLKPLVIGVYNQLPVLPPGVIATAGLPRIAAALTSHMPRTQILKKSEFGEVVATLIVERIIGRQVPVYKHPHKTSPNMPVFGVDVIAFAHRELGGERQLIVYLYQVKTSEAADRPPTVSYELKKEFTNLTAVLFDQEIAFVQRHLRLRQATLTTDEAAIFVLLDAASFDTSDVIFCPFLVVDEDCHYEGVLDPVVSCAYAKPLLSTITRIVELQNVYTLAMATGDA